MTEDGINTAGAVNTKSYDELANYMTRIKLDNEAYTSKGSRTAKVNAAANVTDKADRATVDQVLDPITMDTILNMIKKGKLYEMNGCMSTGKEANVYHGTTDDGQHRAIKVYKTSILVFKDRERYVSGEFRFRNGYSKSSNRQMVEVWAQKEHRNLLRCHNNGIPVPLSMHLKSNVLIMEFLGNDDGWPSPRLRDAQIDKDEFPELYLKMLSYMRLMYQQCRLVHGDLSEYNVLYHNNELYIIDVSQSVEHDHPHSFEFLRMDIKNVNAYFKRKGVQVFTERRLFKFIIMPNNKTGGEKENSDDIVEELKDWDIDEITEQDEMDDAVFRETYIPKSLNEVVDVERDTEMIERGEGVDFVYQDLLKKQQKEVGEGEEEEEEEEDDDDDEYENSDDDESDDDSNEENTKEWVDKPQIERKFADREANKERKKLAKEEAKEKRANKLKKATKKKMIKQSTSRKKK